MTRHFAPLWLILGLVSAAVDVRADCQSVSSTYELIQRGVFEKHDCTVSYCHGPAKIAGMDLRPSASYDNIVNVPSRQDPDLMRIRPRKPEQSYLWLTMAKRTLSMPDVPGEPMPIGRPRLSPEELEGFRLWILAGAPERGYVDGVDELISACDKSEETNDVYIPPCRPGDSRLLLPDLVVEQPTDVRIAYRGGSRKLGFSTAVANVGDGPLIIQAINSPEKPGPGQPVQTVNAVQVIMLQDGKKCARPAGQLVFDPGVGYWSYRYMVDFELRKDDPIRGPVVAHTTKEAYCLLDTDPVRGMNSNAPHQFEAHCTDTSARMGISKGYKDVYHRVHPAQWLDLDADRNNPVDPGTYYLVNAVNPSRLIWEKDTSRRDNVNYTAVTVREPATGGPRARPTVRTRPPKPGRTPRARPTRRPRPARPTAARGPHAAPTPTPVD